MIAKQQEDFKEILAANQKMNELVSVLKKDLDDISATAHTNMNPGFCKKVKICFGCYKP